ncbi:MAG: ThiF family adenylyltransferase [Alphaproteobacteria bacterium]|jgi:hypothetical protein|nr:ThiF family adenylyltransferase [Alphaproteobacteria bacterium]
MFQKLVSHNDDIRRLVDKGYAVAFDTNHLVIRDIPYLDSDGCLQTGAIVTALDFVDEVNVVQVDHQIFFAGAVPHELDGSQIANLAGGPLEVTMSEASSDVAVQRSFSNKPKQGKFKDLFAKIESYVAIISGPAMELHNVDPFTFRAPPEVAEAKSVFKFTDTLTSRANISDLSAKFETDVVALIGLGGTGAYVLDFLVKTPVREIRAFDGDKFHIHNAYRSPGKVEQSEFGMKKSDVYGSRYENFRTGLSVKSKYVDTSCVEDLNDVTFAFVCVDKGTSRGEIFELLLSKKIPFIDVGMGLSRKPEQIGGMLRATFYSEDRGADVREMGLDPLSDHPDDLYKTNIQIAELNSLNACLAVVKFKQFRGFYQDESDYIHVLLNLSDLNIVGIHADEV